MSLIIWNNNILRRLSFILWSHFLFLGQPFFLDGQGASHCCLAIVQARDKEVFSAIDGTKWVLPATLMIPYVAQWCHDDDVVIFIENDELLLACLQILDSSYLFTGHKVNSSCSIKLQLSLIIKSHVSPYLGQTIILSFHDFLMIQ